MIDDGDDDDDDDDDDDNNNTYSPHTLVRREYVVSTYTQVPAHEYFIGNVLTGATCDYLSVIQHPRDCNLPHFIVAADVCCISENCAIGYVWLLFEINPNHNLKQNEA